MFSFIRVKRIGLFAPIAMLAAAISLTMALAARAQSDVSADAPLVGTDSILHSFGANSMGQCDKSADGSDPKGSLTYVQATGLLFGRTSSTNSKGLLNGAIFQINPDGTGYVVDHFFTGKNLDGKDPRHNAMTLVGTTLFGTTLAGGGNANGTIFSINDDGTGYSVPSLFQFPATSSANGGTQPHSCFTNIGSVLYGMTSQGGKSGPPGFGAIFSFNPTATANAYTRLHTFDGKHGSDPHGQLILDPSGVAFYGMTRTGGKHRVGIIFSGCVGISAGVSCKPKFKVLHDFACPGNSTPMCKDAKDGATPDHGTLVQSGTMLFGLTTNGGKYGNGALFSIDTNGKQFKVLHSFGQPTTSDGVNPFGSLTLNGTILYGTTQLGGAKNNGTVFQINTDGSNYARVYDFQNGDDGQNPIDDVLLLNNTLYGMTESGGACAEGAIFGIALP